MANPESESRPTQAERLRRILAAAPQRIEEEFARTTDSWLACFGSAVFGVDLNLSREDTAARAKLDEIKRRMSALQRQYPEKEDIPPEEIKQE